MALVCDFQSCCTASILYGFGQEAAADGEARREGNGKTYEQTRNSIIQRVKQKQGERDGLITAITTNNQVNAIKALTELGFKNSGEVEKLRHPENTICLWWLPLKDWVEPKVEVAAPVVKNVFAQPQVEEVERPGRNFHGLRDANGRFAPVVDDNERSFQILNRYNKAMGLIGTRIRNAAMNGIPVKTFRNEAEIIDRTGQSFQQLANEYRQRGWSELHKMYTN